MQEITNLLLDRTQPVEARIAAAQKLSLESEGAWNALYSLIYSEDEEPALRCAVLRLLPARNRYAAVQALTRPYSNREVRRTAVEVMDRLEPVTGEDAVMLDAQLAALRGPVTDEYVAAALNSISDKLKQLLSIELHILRNLGEDQRGCFVINLPGRWGRENGVLEFLKEELRSFDEKRRRDAVGSLCVLGELESALMTANDSSPLVRAHLATMLGLFREDFGAEVFQQLLNDNDREVAKEAKAALRRLGKLERAKPVARRQNRKSDWGRLLGEISWLRLEDAEIAVLVPDEKVISGWLGEPGALKEEISAAEQRIGVTLPPSYREFLREANGFEQLSSFIRKLYGTREIAWFRVGNQDWIDAYQIGGDISPEEHLKERGDPVRFRTAYLSSCLQISEEGDGAVVLLNPEVVNPEGEWETWFFANWLPGAERFSSFREFMESQLNELKRQQGAKT